MLRCTTTARIIALASTFAFATLATATVSAQDTIPIPSVGELDAALSAASPGDVVTFTGHVTGDFLVPAGVTLRGIDEAVIQGSGVGIALTVVPGGADVTRVENVKVISDGRYGIWVSGAGASDISGVRVTATRGLAIAAEGTDLLSLTNVEAIGPVTELNAASVPANSSPFDTATHGLILLGVDDAALDNVSASGFAEAGAILAASTSAVWDSRFNENVGTGLVIAGGTTTLDNVTGNNTYRGARAADERVAGIGIGTGADVSSTRVRALTNDGFGVFHDGSAIVDHDQLRSLANLEGGVWAQGAEYIGLDRTAVSGNTSTGIVAIDTTYALIADSWVVGTSAGSIGGGPALGDGIQLVNTAGALDDVRLRANARVGLLAALGASQSPDDVSLTDVLVAGRSAALGVIFQQGGSILKTVTEGVTRLGTTGANDELAETLAGMDFLEQWEPPGGLPLAIDIVQQWEPPGGLPPEAGIDEGVFGDSPPTPTDGPF